MYPQDVDPREFSPDPDEDRCPSCGVDAMTRCLPDCDCRFCEGDGEGPTFDDALAGSLELVNAQHDAAKVK